MPRKAPPKSPDLIEIDSSESSPSDVEIVDSSKLAKSSELNSESLGLEEATLGSPTAHAVEDTIINEINEVTMHENMPNKMPDEIYAIEANSPSATTGHYHDSHAAKPRIIMDGNEYQNALEVLVDSLDRLKLHLPEQLPEIVASALEAPLGSAYDAADIAIEEGPTPWDIEEQDQQPVQLLDFEENDCGDTSFYTYVAYNYI
ncbi:hypothetical protein RSAG8_05179, partial [Rhizoctonia solani AG-8 WAC10335]